MTAFYVWTSTKNSSQPITNGKSIRNKVSKAFISPQKFLAFNLDYFDSDLVSFTFNAQIQTDFFCLSQVASRPENIDEQRHTEETEEDLDSLMAKLNAL